MKKISLAVLLACSIVFATQPVMVFASENTENNETISIQPYADSIGWRYQMIDGKLHKRQYNYTQEKWLGKWVLV